MKRILFIYIICVTVLCSSGCERIADSMIDSFVDGIFGSSHPPTNVEYKSNGQIDSIDGKEVDYWSDGQIKSIGDKKVEYGSSGQIYSIGDERVEYWSDGQIKYIGK